MHRCKMRMHRYIGQKQGYASMQVAYVSTHTEEIFKNAEILCYASMHSNFGSMQADYALMHSLMH